MEGKGWGQWLGGHFSQIDPCAPYVMAIPRETTGWETQRGECQLPAMTEDRGWMPDCEGWLA